MLLTLLNIVVPVFAVAGLGFLVGRHHGKPPAMGFINHTNLNVFCPALIFSALVNNPVNLAHEWALVAAGVLIIVLPGLVLMWVKPAGLSMPGFLVPGMFRNTGNIGIPLMMLAYGERLMGDIVLLFVISNGLHFSLGMFLLSRHSNRWLWLRSPNVWAAALGLALASHRAWIPEFVLVTTEMVGQITIPMMLFALGIRLSQDRISGIRFALRINLVYLAAGLLCLVAILWLLPLEPDARRLITLCACLPPAVLNFLLCEQYRIDPATVANVVLFGNVMSVVTIPAVIWFTLNWM
ncbi:MAG: AEC family transporter [Castellaniella sp.]